METLVPFAAMSEKISLQGEFQARDGLLILRFALEDPSSCLQDAPKVGAWKESELQAARAHDLWKTTCFEAFWGEPGTSAYWELNLSGDGKWNLYHFDAYRSPQPPRPSKDFSLLELTTGPNHVYAALKPTRPIHGFEASLCAVLRTKAGTHYLSTRHAGAKPDFHLRDSFKITVG